MCGAPASDPRSHEMAMLNSTLLVSEWSYGMGLEHGLGLCDSVTRNLNLIPAMFLASCEMGEVDPIRYQRCRQVTPEGGCNAAFMLCATRLARFYHIFVVFAGVLLLLSTLSSVFALLLLGPGCSWHGHATRRNCMCLLVLVCAVAAAGQCGICEHVLWSMKHKLVAACAM